MGCSQSISAAIADTKVSSGLKKIDIFPESISGECWWGSLVVTVHRARAVFSFLDHAAVNPAALDSQSLVSSSLSPVNNNNNKSRIEHAAGASAAEQETTASGLTRGNSSDSLPSNCTTNNNNIHHHDLNASGSTAEGTATPPSPVKATHHFDIDEAAESQLKDRSVALFGTNNSGSTAEGTATPPSPVKATHHFDIDEAVASQLKDRSVALFGHSKKNKDDGHDDDEDDPFADDSSAVFEVDEDFLLLDDSDNLSTTSVQDALRGLTLDARMSLVELVRSNSVGHLMTA
jgi:hypothetical protein